MVTALLVMPSISDCGMDFGLGTGMFHDHACLCCALFHVLFRRCWRYTMIAIRESGASESSLAALKGWRQKTARRNGLRML